MTNIYTLKEKMELVQSALNNKLFKIRMNKKDNTLAFICANTDKILLCTTPVVQQNYTKDGIIFITESGTKYDVINVLSIIPTNKEC